MRKHILFFILLLAFTACEKKISVKFPFDTSKVMDETIFSYKYEGQKLIQRIEYDYIYMYGELIDTFKTEINYFYNDKGLKIKELTIEDDNIINIDLFGYNENDSLVQDLSINQFNDTIFWDEYAYYPNGRQLVFHRALSYRFSPTQDVKTTIASRKYDTILYYNKFTYSGNLCTKQIQFDRNKEMHKLIEFEYEDNRLVKETSFKIFDNLMVKESTKLYQYDKYSPIPDFYTLDPRNDTIESCINVLENGTLDFKMETYDYGNEVRKYYFNDGKVTGIINDFLILNLRSFESYAFNSKGELKLVQRYDEQLNGS